MGAIQVERQIRLVLATYRHQLRVGDPAVLARVRDRAEAILRPFEPFVAGDFRLTRKLLEARRELRRGPRSGTRFVKQALDRR